MGFMVTSEVDAYRWLLGGHLVTLIRRLREVPADKWDWTPSPAAPTTRTLAAHTWQWLVCDRQHIDNADIASHSLVPDIPADPSALIAVLEEETANWMQMLEGMDDDQLNRLRCQFGGDNEGTVRGFICHMIQNVIYKHGQFSTLYFAMGLDGDAPYEAPWPNEIYQEVWAEANET